MLLVRIERLEENLPRLDAHAQYAELTLDQRLFDTEKKLIDAECDRLAEEMDALDERYPLVPLGP